jgi:UDP-N-acetylmuramoylalanine--D-glutamate ligase
MHIPQEFIDQLASQQIVILGLGQEGWSSYQFLRQVLPQLPLAVADRQSANQLAPELQATFAQDKYLTLHLGEDHLEQLAQYNLIIKTPGMPVTLPQIQSALQQDIRLSSNLQLFLEIIKHWQQHSQKNSIVQLPYPLTIGVTGTKGKSTTASLIHHLLVETGHQSLLVGNIGQPALDMINQVTLKSIVVMEMSSHQLAELTISPDIAVVQKITSEHLDYYEDTAAYIHSKEAITKYQKVNQYVVYNPNYPNSTKIASLSPGIKIKVAPTAPAEVNKPDIQVYSKSHYLTFRDSNQTQTEEKIISHQDIPLSGEHNLHNVAPAVVIGKLFKIPNSSIKRAISSFLPLPHRLEQVALKNGITYVNDSMATMPDAAISALSCFPEGSVILLAGGHERNQDFKQFAKQIVAKKVKALVLFPANGERLLTTVQQELRTQNQEPAIPYLIARSMPEALEFAQQYAQNGNVVLLAPGAASFGVFKNYADRGDQFREWVKKL